MLSLKGSLKTKHFQVKKFLSSFVFLKTDTIHSKILEKQRRTEMGLYLLTSLGSPPLKSGVTLAIFEASGKTSLGIFQTDI